MDLHAFSRLSAVIDNHEKLISHLMKSQALSDSNMSTKTSKDSSASKHESRWPEDPRTTTTDSPSSPPMKENQLTNANDSR